MAAAQTQAGGAITADTVWRASQGPYVVASDVTVQNNATLTIEAGTTVYMAAATSITVQAGAIQAIGTAQAPIRLTSQKLQNSQSAAPGDWQQLSFNAGTAGSTKLEYVQVEYGKGIVVNGSSPTFNYLNINNNQGAAISADLAASPSGRGNQASGNTLNAIVVPGGDIAAAVSWGVKGIPYLLQSGTVSVGVSPSIATVTPNAMQQGESMTFSLSGTRLSGLTGVTFESSGLSANVLAGGLSTSGNIAVTSAADAALGPVAIRLTTDAGDIRIANAFTVVQQQPKLGGLTPSRVFVGQGPVEVILSGSNLRSQSQVLLNGVSGASNYIDSASIRATIPNQTVPGNASIKLTTPDAINVGQSLTSNEVLLAVEKAQLMFAPPAAAITKGASQNLTLALPYVAPVGGVAIDLVSSVSAVATAPSNVLIPEGATTASVTVNAIALGTTTLTASRAGVTSATANITVVAPPSLSILPATLNIAAGRSRTFTIGSSQVAGVGGLTVALANPNPIAVSVPPSVTIAPGASSASMQLNALSAGTATLSIQASGYTPSSSVVTVHSLSMSLPTGALVAPGATQTISIVLSDVAPAGGETINLSSSNTAALTVPASVTVPEGLSTASITLTGIAPGAATVTASAAGYQYAASLPTALPASGVTTAGTTSWSLSPAKAVASAPRATRGAWPRQQPT